MAPWRPRAAHSDWTALDNPALDWTALDNHPNPLSWSGWLVALSVTTIEPSTQPLPPLPPHPICHRPLFLFCGGCILSAAVWSPPRVLSWVLGDVSLPIRELTLAKKPLSQSHSVSSQVYTVSLVLVPARQVRACNSQPSARNGAREVRNNAANTARQLRRHEATKPRRAVTESLPPHRLTETWDDLNGVHRGS